MLLDPGSDDFPVTTYRYFRTAVNYLGFTPSITWGLRIVEKSRTVIAKTRSVDALCEHVQLGSIIMYRLFVVIIKIILNSAADFLCVRSSDCDGLTILVAQAKRVSHPFE